MIKGPSLTRSNIKCVLSSRLLLLSSLVRWVAPRPRHQKGLCHSHNEENRRRLVKAKSSYAGTIGRCDRRSAQIMGTAAHSRHSGYISSDASVQYVHHSCECDIGSFVTHDQYRLWSTSGTRRRLQGRDIAMQMRILINHLVRATQGPRQLADDI